jgi:hypothetical protein
MLMVVEIQRARFPGLNHVEPVGGIQSLIAFLPSAMSQAALPQPDEHTSMELNKGAIEAGVQDAAAASAAAALAGLASDIASVAENLGQSTIDMEV